MGFRSSFMKKILEVRYNWVPDEKATPGFVYEQYSLGESQLVPDIEKEEGYVWAACEIIEEVKENGYHVRAHFNNGVVEEQWNINKIIYTREAKSEYPPADTGHETGNPEPGPGRNPDKES